MKTPHNDYNQQKITGGIQKVILNEKETAETDELDPKFKDQQAIIKDQPNSQPFREKETDIPGQKPKTQQTHLHALPMAQLW